MTNLPRHIIIDGADGLGKTTICQKLGRMLQMPVIKMPNMKEYISKGSAEEFSKLFNETIVQFSEYDFILDRGFTSSLAYSRVHNRKFDLSYTDLIENILQPKVFILTGRVDKGWKYFRGDDIFNNSDTEQVDRAFLLLANDRRYNVIEVNGKSPDEIVRHIVNECYDN